MEIVTPVLLMMSVPMVGRIATNTTSTMRLLLEPNLYVAGIMIALYSTHRQKLILEYAIISAHPFVKEGKP